MIRCRAAVDDQVHPQPGGRADPPGAPGRRRHRRRPAAGGGFSLQGNAKTVEGQRHPDRDAQFRYINEQVKAHQDADDPVISVDTKKKELVGQFANAGREWRPGGQPVLVNIHDFPQDSAGRAVPYGVYDVTGDTGWVSVGTDHDTAAFAAESVRRWWKAAGQGDYPQARRLLVTADAGGSNGTGPGPGRPSWPPWPSRPGWRSPSATSRQRRRSGTRPGTGCSPTSR